MFFGLKNDINLLFVYACPINSCHTKSRTQSIIEKIETKMIEKKDKCLIMGDLNGRTKMADDFVRDSFDKHSPFNNILYIKDDMLHRGNMDTKPVDEQGENIIDLRKTSTCRILNGRTRGDMFGNFTRYSSNIRDRPSVIDYSICSVDLMEQIHSFSVLPYTGLSDHSCLSASIKVNIETDKNTEPDFADKNTIHTNVAKFTYDKNLKDIFENTSYKMKN